MPLAIPVPECSRWTPPIWRGKTRHPRVVMARAIITHLARQLTTLSYPEIARAIGRPNHSTVITAFQRFAKQLEVDGPVEPPKRS